jgi:hypothetical protein
LRLVLTKFKAAKQELEAALRKAEQDERRVIKEAEEACNENHSKSSDMCAA